MLPAIHMKALLTATDVQLAHQSKEQRAATHEARSNKDLEGFYVYQTYLKRLRRMHKAYVARYRQAHPNSRPPPYLPPPRTTQYNKTANSGLRTTIALPTILKHRLSLQDASKDPDQEDDEGGDSPPPPPASTPTDRDRDSVSPRAIYIPCGREHSFHNTVIPKQGTAKTATSLLYTKSKEGARVMNGAMPFRLWRQEQNKSGTSSFYSTGSNGTSKIEKSPPSSPKRSIVFGQTRYIDIKKNLSPGE